jgi:hypothetical protein
MFTFDIALLDKDGSRIHHYSGSIVTPLESGIYDMAKYQFDFASLLAERAQTPNNTHCMPCAGAVFNRKGGGRSNYNPCGRGGCSHPCTQHTM